MLSSSSASVESEGSDYGDEAEEFESRIPTTVSPGGDRIGKGIDPIKVPSSDQSSSELKSNEPLGRSGLGHQRFPSDATDSAQTPRASKTSYREKDILLDSQQLSSVSKLSSLTIGGGRETLQRPDTAVSGVSSVASGNEIWSPAPDAPEVPKRSSSASHQKNDSIPQSPPGQKDLKLASPTKPINESSTDHTRRPSLSTSSTSSASDYGPEGESDLERSQNLPSSNQGVSSSTSTSSNKLPSLPRMPSRRVLNSPPLDQSTKSSTSPQLGTNRSSSPTKSRNQSIDLDRSQKVESNNKVTISNSAESNLSAEAQAALEAEMQRTADAEDPARPKTLKEARALAKERARLRKERGSESISKPSVGTGNPQSHSSTTQPQSPSLAEEPPKLITRESQRSDNTISSSDQKVVSPSESNSMQRSHSRSAADNLASSSYEDPTSSKESSTKRNERRLAQVPAGLAVSPRTDDPETLGPEADMDELQAAVGAAMEDLSFSSTVTDDTTTPDQKSNERELPTETSTNTISQSNSNESNAENQRSVPDSSVPGIGLSQLVGQHINVPERPESTVSAASGSFVSASNSPPLNPVTLNESNNNSSVDKELPSQSQYASLPSLPQSQEPALPTLQSPPISRLQNNSQTLGKRSMGMGENYRYTDHLQLGRLEVKGRLEVYGKSVPWPNCFDPSSITEKDKKRAAPWERARAYAMFANELTNTDTRLAAWIENVRRPAGRNREFLREKA